MQRGMGSINFRQLIDLAIGTPEPGHVNFYALHCVLYSFAEKLNIIEEKVDCSKFGNISMIMRGAKARSEKHLPRIGNEGNISNENRMSGGADPEPTEEDGAQGAPPAEAAAPTEPPAPASGEAGAAPADTPPAAPDAAPTDAAAAPAAAASVAYETPAEEAPRPLTLPDPLVDLEGGLNDRGSKEYTYTMHHSLDSLEQGGGEVEAEIKPPELAFDIHKGVAIMKDQLELAMEELIILIDMALTGKTDGLKLSQLRSLGKRMRSIQMSNVFVEGLHVDEQSVTIASETEEEEEESSESTPPAVEQILSHSSEKELAMPADEAAEDEPMPEEEEIERSEETEIAVPLPETFHRDVDELNRKYCILTNKYNDLSAMLLEQECLRTTISMEEMEEEMNDLRLLFEGYKETIAQMDERFGRLSKLLEVHEKKMDDIKRTKVSKTDLEIILADKVDVNQMRRKASTDEVHTLQCTLEKKFCEVYTQIKQSELGILQLMDNLRDEIGIKALNDVLKKFKDRVMMDIHVVANALNKFIEEANESSTAAGTRIKVMQDLACLSCDTGCIMRVQEKSPLTRLPDAHATATVSPLVTYEMGTIRKDGIMSYFRKDSFPHAPSAWLEKKQVGMQGCVPRHAGGPHTVSLAKDRLDKMKKPHEM